PASSRRGAPPGSRCGRRVRAARARLPAGGRPFSSACFGDGLCDHVAVDEVLELRVDAIRPMDDQDGRRVEDSELAEHRYAAPLMEDVDPDVAGVHLLRTGLRLE